MKITAQALALSDDERDWPTGLLSLVQLYGARPFVRVAAAHSEDLQLLVAGLDRIARKIGSPADIGQYTAAFFNVIHALPKYFAQREIGETIILHAIPELVDDLEGAGSIENSALLIKGLELARAKFRLPYDAWVDQQECGRWETPGGPGRFHRKIIG